VLTSIDLFLRSFILSRAEDWEAYVKNFLRINYFTIELNCILHVCAQNLKKDNEAVLKRMCPVFMRASPVLRLLVNLVNCITLFLQCRRYRSGCLRDRIRIRMLIFRKDMLDLNLFDETCFGHFHI
jgi:hypothetical protein